MQRPAQTGSALHLPHSVLEGDGRHAGCRQGATDQPTRPTLLKVDWICALAGASAFACGSVSHLQRPLTRAQAEILSEAAAGKPVSLELIPMPSSSRSAMEPQQVESDAASSTPFKADDATKAIVLQHVRFDTD